MSMEAIRNNRGAVSIFLILVLVPCIAISCIFVDVSRVELSKSSAEASADLALNTLLTNYDADLSEYYGLIGSCQNIQDFYTVSAEYFLRTISSQGLSNDEIHLLAGVYANATSDDTIYDLLQVECVSADKTKLVSEVPNANLGNPAMLKDSVVEFMKYRAPIEMATTLIARLKSAGSGVDQFLESDENEPLVEKKQDFYKAEGELLEAAIYTYLAIVAYDESIKISEIARIENSTMKEYAQKIDSYRDAYQAIHDYAVNYLLNTSHLTTAYKRVVYNISNYNSAQIKDLPDVYSSTGTAEDGTTIYYLNGNDLDTQIQAATRSIEELQTAVNSYANATSDLMSKYPSQGSGYNPVQWWVDMHKAVHSGPYGNVHNTISTKGRAVMNAYKNIKAMMEGCEKEPKPEKADKNYKELPDDWATTCQNKLNELQACYQKFLSGSPSNPNDAYIKAANGLASISSQNLNNVKHTTYSVTVDGTSMSLENALIYIAGQLSGERARYEKIIKKLDVAIDGDGEKTKSLDALLLLAMTYDVKFDAYDKAADESTTEMGETERGYIDAMTLQQEINQASVTELKTRLTNIRDQFCILRNKIDTLLYGGTALKDIKSFSTFKNAALTVVTDSGIPLNQNSLNNYSDTTFETLYKPAKGSEIKLEHTDDNNYSPNLKKNPPKLYEYMVENFVNLKLEDLEKEAEDETNAKNDQKDYEEAVKAAVTAYRGNEKATMPGTYSETGVFGVTNLFTSIVDLVGDLFDGKFTNIRDDLFVTTYAMEMFSYATFDREAMYRNMSEDARKAMVPADADTNHTYFKANNVYGDPAGDLEAQDKMWVSTKETDTFNKSLTNKMINLNNNEVYLAEVEYLLYGQSSPVENLKKAYGDIYTIRFTLNTVSAFQHFWPSTGTTTGAFVEGVAVSISGLFAGVVPAPVIKAVLLPILAAMESCKDNARLFAGMPVELYKTDEKQWWYSLEGSGKDFGYSTFFNLLKGKGDAGKNQDKGLFYSDYMTLFVYCGFTHNETAMYNRLGTLIEENMGKITKVDGYDLAKTRMYFSLNADLRVKPLMVTIPYYLDEYDTKGMRTATDWCTYKIDIVRGYS